MVMNTTPDPASSNPPSPAGDADYQSRVRELEGKLVLVAPGSPTKEQPSVGMRGTMRVTPDGVVDIVLQFPAMFDRPAENKVIRLKPDEVPRLLASEQNGAYTYHASDDIDPPPLKDYRVESPRL
jgi:hypothetical protein